MKFGLTSGKILSAGLMCTANATMLATGMLLVVGLIMTAAASGQSSAPAPGVVTALNASQVIDRFIERENNLLRLMQRYHPLVETYVQTVKPDPELGTVPTSDRYYLGRLDLANGLHEQMYTDEDPDKWLDPGRLVRSLFRLNLAPAKFAAAVVPDLTGLDRQRYNFAFLRREFLGKVRCLVFEVTPKPKSGRGRFLGRIWVEDRGFNIVRFNGTYANPRDMKFYSHMDSWRMNIQPGLWLPVAVYTEERNLVYGVLRRDVSLKAQTRLWAYDVKTAGRQQELTDVVIDAGKAPVEDSAQGDASPTGSLRSWQQLAEQNVVDRLEKAGLVAPTGPVDQILETVVRNLEITNNLNLQPEVHCRVLLTTPLESFTIGHTIVISRGLLDVLPDEASLAMVLSHELAHLALGHVIDTNYAFTDRTLFADENVLRQLDFTRPRFQEEAADRRALKLLSESPYKDKLAAAGLFQRQLADRAEALPNLNSPLLGNSLVEEWGLRMEGLMVGSPQLRVRRLDQVAALPLGSRIRLDPWSGRIEMMKSPSVPLLAASEKLPLEIAPVFFNLEYLDSATGPGQSVAGETMPARSTDTRQ